MSTWKIDPAHTDVTFSAKHLMITSVRGRFDRVEGELQLDETRPTESRGEIRVATDSLSTGADRRDDHLRSADFFDAPNHPWITFTATKVEHVRGDVFKVTGDVSIRGVVRPVTFDVEYLGVVRGMSGARHAGFEATGKVNRKDWGLDWNMALEAGGWLVGDEISLTIDIAVDEVSVAQHAAA